MWPVEKGIGGRPSASPVARGLAVGEAFRRQFALGLYGEYDLQVNKSTPNGATLGGDAYLGFLAHGHPEVPRLDLLSSDLDGE